MVKRLVSSVDEQEVSPSYNKKISFENGEGRIILNLFNKKKEKKLLNHMQKCFSLVKSHLIFSPFPTLIFNPSDHKNVVFKQNF